MVAYADDFVILSRGHAADAKAWARAVMTRLGLTLNEAKTSLRNACEKSFNFLGYSFGPHYFPKNGRKYLGASPSKKSVARLKPRIGAILRRGNKAPWGEVRTQLNRVLNGWANYFHYGTCTQAYCAIDHHVAARVRHFLVRRHKVPSRGTGRFSDEIIFGKLGVVRLRKLARTPPPWALT